MLEAVQFRAHVRQCSWLPRSGDIMAGVSSSTEWATVELTAGTNSGTHAAAASSSTGHSGCRLRRSARAKWTSRGDRLSD